MARLAVAATVSGLVLAGAGTALAAGTPQTQGGATATINGLKTYGDAVIHADGGDQHVAAGLFEMSVDGGGTLQTYCVDLHNPTQRDTRYQETPWSGTSLGTNKDAGKIRWILQNSYPQVNDLAALARRAGTGALTEQDAAAGTQVAIWRYSDGAKVDAVDPRAEKLADYLEKSARNTGEPQASLTLDPPAVSGRPGDLLGPVTVHTNAGVVTVTPPTDAVGSGLRIIDKTGKVITSAKDGSRLYVDIPEDAPNGTAQLTVQASTTVPVGRAFASESRSQTQILAGSSESTVSATATATWAAKGAVPAVSARKNCAKSGVDITVANKEGDEPFTFELMDVDHTIPAGASRTVTVPLQEDQAYDFTITGPNGFRHRFTGVLDCKTQGSAISTQTTQILSEPSPVTDGGTLDSTDLAATGGSAITPLIAGAAIGLVVIGGAVLVLLRKRDTGATD
ncbi:TQXA domain-containing protein [Streptomyces pluripotens]|uniref:TQXA domain-containing protein n=1 Tax=Streptomyces pluripotens TaxID=1355015 RepID=A0A221NX03_9ACTN|nr:MULTISPECIES: Cys-Gln thioester bond-forming surface protein [Streptomyces]ARP70271.1 TQXA domain-containing protein [Streptomyces pluripotens]ASN24529.1 TQXA domain-containing protein [Streptomyces pluripotens]KIE28051.1 peptidase [Streptomyces sp. MUSC 125]MCH0558370.1 Cys-Gln thioester bond-forming surface protein [Streptomyces sp. MUM 16J]